MRVCPQCARKNKPRAKFCDQCGFEFVGYGGSQQPTRQQERMPPAETLPVNDTAPGVPRLQDGIPEELQGKTPSYRKTQKMNAPAVGVPPPAGEETVKVPVANGGETAPAPEATIQGAFYLRQQEAVDAASEQEHVGWLVESGAGDAPPRAVWPLTRGVTLVGAHAPSVGKGILIERDGVSDVHALVLHRHPRTWVVDLASAQGSSVNGEPLTALQGRVLADRDELRLAGVRLVFRRVAPKDAPVG